MEGDQIHILKTVYADRHLVYMYVKNSPISSSVNVCTNDDPQAFFVHTFFLWTDILTGVLDMSVV